MKGFLVAACFLVGALIFGTSSNAHDAVRVRQPLFRPRVTIVRNQPVILRSQPLFVHPFSFRAPQTFVLPQTGGCGLYLIR